MSRAQVEVQVRQTLPAAPPECASFILIIERGSLIWEADGHRRVVAAGSVVVGGAPDWHPAFTSPDFSGVLAWTALPGAGLGFAPATGGDALVSASLAELTSNRQDPVRLGAAATIVLAEVGTQRGPIPIIQAAPGTPKLLGDLIAKVRAKPQAPWSIQMAANAVGFSAHYFTRVFRKQFGMSFHDYLERVRCTQAAELLLQTSQSMETISHAVGFGSATSMRQAIRHQFGLNPSDLRGVHAPKGD